MNRRWLTGHLPAPAEVRRRLGIGASGDGDGDGGGVRGWLARTFRNPALWTPTRRSVSGGVAVGLFVGWMPIPLQMVLAAVLASALRVHVPVSMVMVWITNPLTIVPLLYAARRTGSTLLGETPRAIGTDAGVGELLRGMGEAWPALLTGCLFWGACSAVLGFFATRLLWRVSALRRWRRRPRVRIRRRDVDRPRRPPPTDRPPL